MDLKTSQPEVRLECPSCGTVEENDGKQRAFCSQCRFPLLRLGGRYELERELAIGGFGAVYLAHDFEEDQAAVVKLIKPELMNSKDLLIRFRREIRITTQLAEKNEHVVRLLSHGEEKGVGHFYAMEYLQGLTLTDYLDSMPRRSYRDIFWIFQQFCEVLQDAHESGIVHRDLKPDNLFVIARDGDPLFLKVLDFGIAKSLVGTVHEGLTSTVIGTPHYMAPEQCTNGTIDVRTDIYSMGIILYELLTQAVPFNSNSGDTLSIVFAHVTAEAPSMLGQDSWLPLSEEIDRVVAKCLSKEPSERYQSVSEFWQAITRCPDYLYANEEEETSPSSISRKPSHLLASASPEKQTASGLEVLQEGRTRPDSDDGFSPKGDLETLEEGMEQERREGLKRPAPADHFVDAFAETDVATFPLDLRPAPADYFDDATTALSSSPLHAVVLPAKRPLAPTAKELAPTAKQREPVQMPATEGRSKGAIIVVLSAIVALAGVAGYLIWQISGDASKPSSARTVAAAQPRHPSKRSATKASVKPKQTPMTVGGSGVLNIRPLQLMKRPVPRRVTVKVVKARPAPRRRVVRVPRRRAVFVPRRPTVPAGPCGAALAGRRWVHGKILHPGSGGQLQTPGCSGCRIVRRAGGFCIAIPRTKSRIRVKIRASGYQTCTMWISQQRKLRWHLKADDPDGLGGSTYYKCTR